MKTHVVFAFLGVLALPVLIAGCSATAERSAASGPVLRGSLGQARVRSIRIQLGEAESRIRELETALAEQSSDADRKTIAALQTREQELRRELTQVRQESETLRADLAEARAAAAAAAEASGRVGASPQLASMQVELEGERRRRIDAEDQLAKMREETSGSPFETANETSLKEARAQIDELSRQLSGERRAREDAERRFAELQVEMNRQATLGGGSGDRELSELQDEQRRLMASIQQDLEASRRREQDLRDTLAQVQGGGSEHLTDRMKNLEAENQALQSSLDAEHERNVELAAKLEVATRVADLIFKMRRDGRLPPGEAGDAPD